MSFGRPFGDPVVARPDGRGRRLRLPRHIEVERRLLALRYLSRTRARLERERVGRAAPGASTESEKPG